MEHHIVISFLALLCAVVFSSNEIDPAFDNSFSTTYDYDKIYQIHQVCAEKWGVDYYMSYIPPDNLTAANESIRCAYECEMTAKKFIGNDGQLDMQEVIRAYYNDWGAHYSNETKEMTDYVLEECGKEYNNDDGAESCGKAYRFVKCLEQKQSRYYDRKNLLNCIDNWQGKKSDNLVAISYLNNIDRCPPYGTSYCFVDVERYITRNGVDELKALFEESGFLQEHTEIKKSFYSGVQICYDVKQSDDRKCAKNNAFFTCLMKEFYEITPFFNAYDN